MNEFDKNIGVISDNICKNIEAMDEGDRGFFSQNIIKNLRTLVEAVDQRIYNNVVPIKLNDYEDIKKAISYVSSQGKLRFLSRFHDFLQASVSHYLPDEDNAVRLMLKYYEWLLKIRDFCKKSFGINILYNLEDYPLDDDKSLSEYYEKIAIKLDTVRYSQSNPNTRYYVLKNRPFFVNGRIYYEITIISADDYSSKFNHITVFSNREIPSYYAIKLDFIQSGIEIINRQMPISIINNYKVAIRPVELSDIATILNVNKVSTGAKEYNYIMDFLTQTGYSFTEILDWDMQYYNELKRKVSENCNSNNTFAMLDKCRSLCAKKSPGHNIVRYLLLKLRHAVLKQQIASIPNNWISYLCLKNECLPFDEMPFDASLYNHNPSLYDVFASINSKGHEDELLARRIRINSEQKVQLFTDISEVEHIGDVAALSSKFNSRLIPKHQSTRSLIVDNKKVYINGYVSDTVEIINDLINRLGSGLKGFKNSMQSWIASNPAVDCEEKKAILQEVFADSNVAMIYGSAGTGKTTLIKYLSDYFADNTKLFLANTNPAKEHLRRQIKTKNSSFSTIASSGTYLGSSFDIVFIDECSTVDNFAMRNLLGRLSCKLLVLVGDIYQIQSIKFGNWFGLARYFLPAKNIFELKTPFRSQDNNLIGLWHRVRMLDKQMAEYIYRQKYSSVLDDSLFVRDNEDEIILCLNYDGLYGINNVNRFMQNDNPNPEISWDTWIFKVGDPIIFNENNRFYPVLYNNLKGWIRDIKKEIGTITFIVEIDLSVNEFDAEKAGFELLECDVPGHSKIRFSVNSFVDDDTHERDREQVIPFQVAYAVSIHKAQGLEYDSVKIVVTNEIEDRITHNIFYTAITRAINKLKIYWTPETQQKILASIEPISYSKDAHILANKFGLTILNEVEQIKKNTI